MDEVTPEMLELARQCAAKYWQTGDPGDEYAARMILSGEWDGEAYVQAALAAIKETSEAQRPQPSGDEIERCQKAICCPGGCMVSGTDRICAAGGFEKNALEAALAAMDREPIAAEKEL